MFPESFRHGVANPTAPHNRRERRPHGGGGGAEPIRYDARVAGIGDLFSSRKRRIAQARRLELAGQLEQAAELYLQAEQGDEAARVLLLRTDAEPDLGRRIVLCGQAARVGRGSEPGRTAERRKALLRYELCRSPAGSAMRGELGAIAGELEQAGEWQRAAEAYALGGDRAGELRVLEQAGAIEQLEKRLGEDGARERHERERTQLLEQLGDLDRVAERRKALRLGRGWLEREPGDEAVSLELERIRARLLSGPIVALEIEGRKERYALGAEVTIGRAEATIVVCSSAVSRQHLRLSRREGLPWIEDLATRNGTTLGGARVARALPVGAGLTLLLAGQVDCRIEPVDAQDPAGPVAVVVADGRTVAPLGPGRAGPWLLSAERDGELDLVLLRTPAGQQAPCLGALRLGPEVELAVGDELRAEREGPVVLRVLPRPAE